MPNAILLIFMNTGTAMAEEVIFTDIYIFLLNERKRSTAATCSQLTIFPHFCPKLVTRAIMPAIKN
jgi:hypothetical protein